MKREIAITAAVSSALALALAGLAKDELTIPQSVSSGSNSSPPMELKAAVVTAGPDGYSLDAKADNVPVHFLVDTGASYIGFGKETAAKLGIDPSQTQTRVVTMANGDVVPMKYFVLKRLQIGPCLLTDVPSAILDGAPNNFLGLTAVRDLHLDMDYGRMAVGCETRPPPPPPPPYSHAAPYGLRGPKSP